MPSLFLKLISVPMIHTTECLHMWVCRNMPPRSMAKMTSFNFLLNIISFSLWLGSPLLCGSHLSQQTLFMIDCPSLRTPGVVLLDPQNGVCIIIAITHSPHKLVKIPQIPSTL